MEQGTSVDKAVKVLTSMDPRELDFVKRAITVANDKKLPLQAASVILAYKDAGTKVSFKDPKGIPHVGTISKINQKYVRVFDPTINRNFNVLPSSLKPATKDEEEMAKGAEPRQKRAYSKRRPIKKDEQGRIIFGRRSTDKT